MGWGGANNAHLMSRRYLRSEVLVGQRSASINVPSPYPLVPRTVIIGLILLRLASHHIQPRLHQHRTKCRHSAREAILVDWTDICSTLTPNISAPSISRVGGLLADLPK